MVEGQFCSYDPAAAGGGLPAGIAEGRSEHCAEHRYAMPLRDALRAAGDADASDPGRRARPRALRNRPRGGPPDSRGGPRDVGARPARRLARRERPPGPARRA
ncbi:hypothetical protein THAOC_30574, partial [Thalassiosira oceanica]